jgi:hypothetical protein
VYSCLWTTQEIRFFVDGRLLSVEPNSYWHRPMDVVLSLGLRGPLDKIPSADGFPTWAAVDYLRVWGPVAKRVADPVIKDSARSIAAERRG